MFKNSSWFGTSFIRMGAYDRRSSTLDDWAPTPARSESLPHCPCSSQNSFFIGSCYSCCFTPCNIKLAPQIVFSPRLNVLEAHMGFPHPAALATNYTVVLEQRQSHERTCLFPWKKRVRNLSIVEDSYLGSLLEVIQKVTERQRKRLLWICTKMTTKIIFPLFLVHISLLGLLHIDEDQPLLLFINVPTPVILLFATFHSWHLRNYAASIVIEIGVLKAGCTKYNYYIFFNLSGSCTLQS